jgi:hypothetical protein
MVQPDALVSERLKLATHRTVDADLTERMKYVPSLLDVPESVS